MVSPLNHILRRWGFLAAIWLLAVCLIPSMSWARNPYTYTDVVEGDPGDGVLQPAPQVVPEPSSPVGGNRLPVFQVTLIPMGDQHYLPVFEFYQDGKEFFLLTRHPLSRVLHEGRWHHAP